MAALRLSISISSSFLHWAIRLLQLHDSKIDFNSLISPSVHPCANLFSISNHSKRRVWDSNPWTTLRAASCFQDRCVKPDSTNSPKYRFPYDASCIADYGYPPFFYARRQPKQRSNHQSHEDERIHRPWQTSLVAKLSESISPSSRNTDDRKLS